MAEGGTAVDLDPEETREWLESLEAVVAAQGTERAAYLLSRLHARASHCLFKIPVLPDPPNSSLSVTNSTRWQRLNLGNAGANPMAT